MALFNSKSRYVRHARVAFTTDRRGREVPYVTPAQIPEQSELGSHRLRDGQRLDHLANHYLADPTGFWKIAAHNNVMDADAALSDPLVEIPFEEQA